MDFISCLMSRGSHPLILQGGLTITQTQRPVEIDAPDGNRTHVSRTHPGVLSQLNYGNIREPANAASRTRFVCGNVSVTFRGIRWASGVIERRHSMPGIEPGPPRLSPRTVRPP